MRWASIRMRIGSGKVRARHPRGAGSGVANHGAENRGVERLRQLFDDNVPGMVGPYERRPSTAQLGAQGRAGEQLRHPRRTTGGGVLHEEVAAGRPVPETPRLLRRWVVLGMPPRYARPPGAPGAIGSVARGLLRGAVRRLRDRRCSDRVQ